MSRQINPSLTLLPPPKTIFARRWFKILILLIIILIVVVILFLVQEFFARTTVAIDVNGNVREVRTDAQTVGEALQDAGILIDPADKVNPALNTPLAGETTITVIKAHQLVLEIGGEVRRVYTHSSDPMTILIEQGILLGPNDRLYVNQRPYQSGTLAQQSPRHLQVIRAKNFTIVDGSQRITGSSIAHTVGEVLEENNLQLYLADRVFPPTDAPLTDGMEIMITRSSPVHIVVDGQNLDTRAVGSSVNEVLNMLGLPLIGLDYSIPAEDDAFSPDMEIQVIRVVESVEVEQSPIPFDIVIVSAADLAPDEEHIIQEGAAGLQESRVRIRRENDLIVSRVVQETWTVIEPIPQIVASGTAE